MPPLPAPVDDAAARRPYAAWGAGLALAGVVLVLVALGRGTFRPEDLPAVPPGIGLPEPVAPIGELDDVPTTFRWTPGGDDVDLTQVLVYRSGVRPIWRSAPLRGSVRSLDVPREVFLGIPAGEGCSWRIREASGGRPRATSRVAEFTFAHDAQGYGPGENEGYSEVLRD